MSDDNPSVQDPPDEAEQPPAEPAEEVVDIDAGVPHGEYPTEGTFGYSDKSMAEADAENQNPEP